MNSDSNPELQQFKDDLRRAAQTPYTAEQNHFFAVELARELTAAQEKLAAEKDRAERYYLDMLRLDAKLAAVTPALMQKVNDLKDEREAWISAAKITRDERGQALAACAQKDAALKYAIEVAELCQDTIPSPEFRQLIAMSRAALSSNAGQGWKSPEEVAELEEDRLRILNALEIVWDQCTSLHYATGAPYDSEAIALGRKILSYDDAKGAASVVPYDSQYD